MLIMSDKMSQNFQFQTKINYYLTQVKWFETIWLSYVHIAAIYGLYLAIVSAKWETIVMLYIIACLSNIGNLSAAHRYGSHKAFKANRPLTVILMVLHTLSGTNNIMDWVRDHQTHHKYEGTNADSTNINRGFLFAHIGYLMLKPHPECEEKRNKVDVSYLWSNPIWRFQTNYYIPLFVVFCVLIPTLIPYYLFGETLINSYYLCFVVRYVYTLQLYFCGNSLAHMDFGAKPYDRFLSASQNKLLNYLTLGGMYHNYHHVYPWDYRASEFGWDANFNINTAFIDFFHSIGWAYDLKVAPKEVIKKRKERTGGEQSLTWIQRNGLYDSICGFLLSSAIVWILLGLKIIYKSITNLS